MYRSSYSLPRRQFLSILAGAPGASALLRSAFSPDVGIPDKPVIPTPRCFLINGKPKFLVSGSIHYFRVPNELWRDRLLKAKRAGLNCIETYIAWNFHEPEEGTYLFEQDCDIEEFFRICRELGLYSFVRTGPYIDSEWDSGGYPAWLIGKPGSEFRTMNSVTIHFIRLWFKQLIPRIARNQVTRGGPIILVQSENEYLFCERPGSSEYLRFLMKTLRELGVEVPITDCNGLQNPLPSSLKTINASGPGTIVSQYRKLYPNTPPFLSEFWIGPSVQFWDQPLVSRTAHEVQQDTMAALAQRAMYNFYMFHGGTNFGFWAGNSVHSNHSWITTRYDFSAPVAEGGALNAKYFAVKNTNLLAINFQDFLCHAAPTPIPVEILGPVCVRALQ
ncbi:MAG: beta-galactosidase, partial [Candidatus Micrarchaeaceae archaeon]